MFSPFFQSKISNWSSKMNHLERQVSLFFNATSPLKPATIALKIGHLAFQALFF